MTNRDRSALRMLNSDFCLDSHWLTMPSGGSSRRPRRGSSAHAAPVFDAVTTDWVPGDGTINPRFLEVCQPSTADFEFSASPADMSVSTDHYPTPWFPSDCVDTTPSTWSYDTGDCVYPYTQSDTQISVSERADQSFAQHS